MTEDEKAVARMRARDVRAALAGDHATLRALMDDDAVVLPPGGRPLRGARDLDAMYEAAASTRAESEVVSYEQEFEELEIVGRHAFEWGTVRGSTRSRETGEETPHAYHVLRVLRRQGDGEWKVYRTIWNDADPTERRPLQGAHNEAEGGPS